MHCNGFLAKRAGGPFPGSMKHKENMHSCRTRILPVLKHKQLTCSNCFSIATGRSWHKTNHGTARFDHVCLNRNRFCNGTHHAQLSGSQPLLCVGQCALWCLTHTAHTYWYCRLWIHSTTGIPHTSFTSHGSGGLASSICIWRCFSLTSASLNISMYLPHPSWSPPKGES